MTSKLSPKPPPPRQRHQHQQARMKPPLSPKPRGARKPETVQRMVTSMRVSSNLHLAETYISLAARHIDTAGDLAGTSEADMLACYASNVLQENCAAASPQREGPGSGEARRPHSP